jgi:hypothetical protein
MFADVLAHFEHPATCREEFTCLSCLTYANFIADDNNHGLTPWKWSEPCDEVVLADVGVSEEEVPNVVMLVSRHTAAYVPLTRAA